MSGLFAKLRRRLEKSVLQYGVLITIGRCFLWPLMYVGWRLVELTPSERRARRTGAEFDRTFGVDTNRDRFSEWAADIDSPNWAEGTGYDATPPDDIRESIRQLEIPHHEYTFIDLGSGKGRVPLVASEFPFRECIGVEYAPDLHEIAVRNTQQYRNPEQRCHKITPVCADAATYLLPDTPLVLFFAHPFGDHVLEGFLENLRRSYERAPRKIFVIYYDPICGDLFEKAGYVEVNEKKLSTPRPVPKFLLNPLGWFAVIGFANKRGAEYVIYENPIAEAAAMEKGHPVLAPAD